MTKAEEMCIEVRAGRRPSEVARMFGVTRQRVYQAMREARNPSRKHIPAHHKDTGCSLAPSCLNCPFPQCIEDRPDGRGGHRRTARNQDILRLYGEGKGTEELAAIFSVGLRTIERVLKVANNAG